MILAWQVLCNELWLGSRVDEVPLTASTVGTCNTFASTAKHSLNGAR